MTDLSKLIERLKAATGADAELDAEIWLATIPGASRRNVMAEWRDERPIWDYSDPERNLAGRSLVPKLTASVDASLALVERLLPGWRYDLHSPRMGQVFEAVLIDSDKASRTIRAGKAPTAPLAILICALTALQSKDETNVEGV